MAARKQTEAAKTNISKAGRAARQQRSLATMPKATKAALGQHRAAVARRTRNELARALGQH
jgi:hypothetical protein